MTESPDAPPDASPSLEGAVLDGWRLEARIGRGGMGEVWSARHVDRDEEAAVKVIFARPDRRAEAARRFEREVRAASKIGHPGIVRVLGFGIDEARDGAMYIVMERLEGEPLRAWLDRARGEPDRREGLALVRELLDALAAAHDCVDADGAPAPIIHRDLKPENVFVGPEGSAPRVKLLDFGIARQADAAPVTDTGVGMGTAAYMSPEQATDARAVGPASDVWSIGVMLYELLAGARPFEAPSKNEVISRILTSDPVPLEEAAPGIAPSLARLVGRCLAKDPRRRPADAAALARALDAIASEAPSLGAPAGERGAAGAGQTTRDPGPARRSNGAWIAMGALALVAAALVAIRFGALEGLARPAPERASEPATPAPPPISTDPGPTADLDDANRFVAVPGDDHPLGLAADEPDEGVSGFRPRAGVRAPAEPFAIHAHEVTWAELEAWLAREGRAAPEVLGAARPAWLPERPSARARLPATGVAWSLARDYCAAIGGALPTEEQWEHAARGASSRPYAWGDAPPPDEPAGLAPVMSRPHDRTPGADPIWDLTGNAREWTADLFRASDDGAVGAWASSEGRTFRAVRGLPLLTTSRWRPPSSAPIAHRVPLCATGPCPEGTDEVRLDVGFRCARR